MSSNGPIISAMSIPKKNGVLIMAAVGHFSVDLFAGLLPVLLAQLSRTFGLSNKQIGFAVMAYTLTSALSQPAFGYLADRLSGRLVAAGGIAWLAVWMAVAGFAPSYYAMVGALVIAGLGSGAYHPQAAVRAGSSTRKGSGISIFFLGGRLGFTTGPLVGGLILSALGPQSMVIASALGIAAAFLVWNAFPATSADELKSGSEAPASSSRFLLYQVPLFLAVGFLLSQGLRSGINESLSAYIPKHYLDQGLNPAQYGLLASAFVAGSSLGGLIGGFLADRWEKRLIIPVSMAFAGPAMYLFLHAGPALRLPLILFTGLLMSIPFTPALMMAQELMPKRQSLITGSTMSFFFVSGALGTLLIGVLADVYGLGRVLDGAAVVLGIAFLASLLLVVQLRPVAVQRTTRSEAVE